MSPKKLNAPTQYLPRIKSLIDIINSEVRANFSLPEQTDIGYAYFGSSAVCQFHIKKSEDLDFRSAKMKSESPRHDRIITFSNSYEWGDGWSSISETEYTYPVPRAFSTLGSEVVKLASEFKAHHGLIINVDYLSQRMWQDQFGHVQTALIKIGNEVKHASTLFYHELFSSQSTYEKGKWHHSS